jgi:hypothetical protein
LTAPREQRSEARDLRRILRDRIRAVEDAARRSGGDVSAEELEAIDRLKRLVDISSSSRFERSARVLAMTIVVLGVIVCAALLQLPMRRATITLDASTTYVGFRPQSGITILSPLLPATTINAQAIDSVVVTGRVGARDTTLVERSIQATVTPPASMSVAAIDVAPFESVRLGARQNELQISVGDAAGSTKLEMNGAIGIRGSAQRTVNTRSGAARLWFGPRPVPLRVTVADSGSAPLTPVARIDSLQVYRVVASGAATRDSSTITEGKLDITSVENASTKLGSSEAIQLEGLEGDLKAVELHSGALVVSFAGTVRNIRATNGLTSRSLMPSMFSYLASQHTAEVIWTTLGWVVVTALSILRWWHRPKSLDDE